MLHPHSGKARLGIHDLLSFRLRITPPLEQAIFVCLFPALAEQQDLSVSVPGFRIPQRVPLFEGPERGPRILPSDAVNGTPVESQSGETALDQLGVAWDGRIEKCFPAQHEGLGRPRGRCGRLLGGRYGNLWWYWFRLDDLDRLLLFFGCG